MTTPAASPARRLVISHSDLGPRSSTGFKPVRTSDPGSAAVLTEDPTAQPSPPPRMLPTAEDRKMLAAVELSQVGGVQEEQREVGQKLRRDVDREEGGGAPSDVTAAKRHRAAQPSPERQHRQQAAVPSHPGAQQLGDSLSIDLPGSHQRASSPQGSPHCSMTWHAQPQQQPQAQLQPKHNDRGFASNVHTTMTASDLLSHAMGYHGHADRAAQQWGAADVASAGMEDIAGHPQQNYQQQHNSISAHRRQQVIPATQQLREQAGLQRTREETQ